MSEGSYWGLERKTEEAFFPGGWFRPFDVGHLDEDGFLYYADRAADTIHTAAGVVYPHLVETAVLRHADVANCGVVGLGEPGSEEVVAAIVLKAGVERTPRLQEEILAAARSGLEDHGRPSRIVVVDDLPTVLGGAKVQRAALKEQLTADLPPR